MVDLLIENATIVNEGRQFTGSVLIKDRKIHTIAEGKSNLKATKSIDAKGLLLIPGVIDDQVHFREPGLVHKGDIRTESRAAAAGGITSYMEMPNTMPQTVTQKALKEKFKLAEENSLVNYSFYIGATNDNLEELMATDPKTVCGIKIFMGASTGNMLVDNPDSLKNIFANVKLLVAVHCEDENTIRNNTQKYLHKFGQSIPVSYHPEIRSEEACYKSSSLAVGLAQKHGTRLHILHLSTEKELELFHFAGKPETKQITSEVCIHHLWFNKEDYEKLGAKIKWNPAIKTRKDQNALLNGLLSDKIDVIATDHAPHTLEEKNQPYTSSPSGGPLVQHSLPAMLEFYLERKIPIEKVVEKMCHTPADIFRIEKRGYLREGYWADCVLVDLNHTWAVSKSNILYKCGWSPFENVKFRSKVYATIVNGTIVYSNGSVIEGKHSMPLQFNR
jgi:dihydroorotase